MLTRRPRKSWTRDEDDALQVAIAATSPDSPICWTKVAPLIPGRTAKDCRKRWTSGLNHTVARGCWSQEEDELLIAAVQKFGTDWGQVAQAVKVRTGDQCSNRWSDVLDPAVRREPWTREEDCLLVGLYIELGTSWNKIASHTQGRRALNCRNRACKLLVQRGLPKPGTFEAEDLRLALLASGRNRTVDAIAEIAKDAPQSATACLSRPTSSGTNASPLFRPSPPALHVIASPSGARIIGSHCREGNSVSDLPSGSMPRTPSLHDNAEWGTQPSSSLPLDYFDDALFEDVAKGSSQISKCRDAFRSPEPMDTLLCREQSTLHEVSVDSNKYHHCEWPASLPLMPPVSLSNTSHAHLEMRRPKASDPPDSATSPQGGGSPPIHRPLSPLGELETLFRSPCRSIATKTVVKTGKRASSKRPCPDDDAGKKRQRQTHRTASAMLDGNTEASVPSSLEEPISAEGSTLQPSGKEAPQMTSRASPETLALSGSVMRSLLECASNPAYVLEQLSGCDGKRASTAPGHSQSERTSASTTSRLAEHAGRDFASQLNIDTRSSDTQEPAQMQSLVWASEARQGSNSANEDVRIDELLGQVHVDAIGQKLISAFITGTDVPVPWPSGEAEPIAFLGTTPSMTEGGLTDGGCPATEETEHDGGAEVMPRDLLFRLDPAQGAGATDDGGAVRGFESTSAAQSPYWAVLESLLELQGRTDSGSMPRTPVESVLLSPLYTNIDMDGRDKDELEVVGQALDAAKSLLETMAVQMHMKGGGLAS